MIVYSKMTALANEIRELSGTEEAMGLDDMAEHVGEANTDVATEADLIEQIASALEGKVGNSGEQNIENSFPYKITFSCSGIDGFLSPVICYGSNKDVIVILTNTNVTQFYTIEWTYTNCIQTTVGTCSYFGDFAIFNRFKGDANIVATWTPKNTGDFE